MARRGVLFWDFDGTLGFGPHGRVHGRRASSKPLTSFTQDIPSPPTTSDHSPGTAIRGTARTSFTLIYARRRTGGLLWSWCSSRLFAESAMAQVQPLSRREPLSSTPTDLGGVYSRTL